MSVLVRRCECWNSLSVLQVCLCVFALRLAVTQKHNRVLTVRAINLNGLTVGSTEGFCVCEQNERESERDFSRSTQLRSARLPFKTKSSKNVS